ncbi:transporter substrate-binding domain-containing protein [Fusibacter ferrireducens]|uniref:Transporter substrate-binding domain-containing protein n=1 Tax=Fusibacter ferrireducens TaxID=2785058 RepID=A0ABR9ZXH8_9FIRM|nr:transporter substrate-binding domain-containing protein [Fusibacter ferrireducens]MBF4695172.1 transporter substrate-binding domain-containing protein [Fusibacter ferrireducens]
MKKRIFALLLVSIMVLSLLAGCASKAETPETSGTEKKVFRVGMECSYAPFNWTQKDDSNGAVPIMDSSDYAYGYDVEMAKRIAEANGWALEVYKIDWDGLILALNANKIDAIIAGMGVTEERQKSVDFSEYYWSGDMVMIVNVDSPYASATSLEDFRGTKVTSQLNTVWMDLIPQIPEVDEKPGLGGNSEILVAVRSGKLDGTILGETEAYSAVLANPDLAVVKFEEGKGFDYSKGEASNAVAVRKGDSETLEAINKVLSSFSAEDRSALMEKIIKMQPILE